MQRPSDIDVWVLAGQSNMEGVGALAEAVPPDERVWCFTSAGQWDVAREPLHCFWESFTAVHRDLCRGGLPAEYRDCSDADLAAKLRRERTHGTGLGLAFGKTMADHTGRPVGLIPAAHGATSLDQWSPALKGQGGCSLYGSMLERIARAGGTLRGILWYQGESEGWNSAAAASYGRRLGEWIAAVRDDVHCGDLPVIVVQIGNTTLPSPSPAAWSAVRLAQDGLPDQVPHTAVTSAIDLGLVDPIHLHADALVRLGRRMARQALALQAHPGMSVGPRLQRLEALSIERGIWRREALGAVRLHFTGVTGAWTPADHMCGFEVRTADGAATPDNAVFQVCPDRQVPGALHLELNLPLAKGQAITYGWGLNPPCSVVDAADMPLCAFAAGPESLREP